jgi:chromosomal replication initiation ATPase DnaA
LRHIIDKICERYNIQEAELSLPGKNPLQSKPRAVLSLLVRKCDHLSLEGLAKFLKRDASGLSKLANRLEQKCSSSASVAKELSELQTWLQDFV